MAASCRAFSHFAEIASSTCIASVGRMAQPSRHPCNSQTRGERVRPLPSASERLSTLSAFLYTLGQTPFYAFRSFERRGSQAKWRNHEANLR
jgi:hypothetical protein